jgi:hypothetical protein
MEDLSLEEAFDVAPQELAPRTPLELLPPSPWRSLGGYLDYSSWPDGPRFLELDRAIEAARKLEAERAISRRVDHDREASFRSRLRDRLDRYGSAASHLPMTFNDQLSAEQFA